MKEGGVVQVQVCQKLQEVNIQALSYTQVLKNDPFPSEAQQSGEGCVCVHVLGGSGE